MLRGSDRLSTLRIEPLFGVSLIVAVAIVASSGRNVARVAGGDTPHQPGLGT